MTPTRTNFNLLLALIGSGCACIIILLSINGVSYRIGWSKNDGKNFCLGKRNILRTLDLATWNQPPQLMYLSVRVCQKHVIAPLNQINKL